jgi:hypothetical protein
MLLLYSFVMPVLGQLYRWDEVRTGHLVLLQDVACALLYAFRCVLDRAAVEAKVSSELVLREH